VCLRDFIDNLNRGCPSIDDTLELILWNACTFGCAELLEPLFWRGASFSTIDISGETPLTRAVRSGDLDTVFFALALGADPNSGHAFTLASLNRRHDIMTALVKHGADVNKTEGGYTRLDRALEDSNLDDVRVLLSLGADPNLPGVQESLLRVIQSAAVFAMDVIMKR
jgi:ankyrin repeat protein